jgi:hypothetical protein
MTQRVNDCCLTPNEEIFSYIMTEMAIVLSVFLRLMASYCPFCIFKLFLTWVGEEIMYLTDVLPSLVIHCSSNLSLKIQKGQ